MENSEMFPASNHIHFFHGHNKILLAEYMVSVVPIYYLKNICWYLLFLFPQFRQQNQLTAFSPIPRCRRNQQSLDTSNSARITSSAGFDQRAWL
ncbi:MAG TPA: hypothetical protein HPP97_09945 [Desulfuromonadales bacterium]|nr:hypothetical protein [Desulfuromonadales bacterium]